MFLELVLMLGIGAIYSWLALWVLGYHGVFTLLIIILLEVFYLAVWDWRTLWVANGSYTIDLYNWVSLGNYSFINFNFIGDFLSVGLLIIMSGGLIIVLSFVYVEMWEDKEGAIFAIELVIFATFMAILVGGGNLYVFYLGWEGIGLTSLFLINFWSERPRGFKAAFKVYCINKVGDFLILVGICILTAFLGNVDFGFIEGHVLALIHLNWIGGSYQMGLIDIISLLFVLGGGVKSAQFGFHIWLLEAMEAPLGASALMHSSTLVIAGIILVIRLYPLIFTSSIALNFMVGWGAWTALFASLIACFQYELKIILAYSTIASMGFIYCLLGLGALREAFLYLFIHAFIKIFLFLVIGAIIFHCGGCQDIRWMGGLLVYIPGLWVAYVVGSLGLAGLPYWSGYYCKSTTWAAVTQAGGYWVGVRVALLISTLLTYCYLARLGFLVFGGLRGGHSSLYRSRWVSLLVCFVFLLLGWVVAYCGNFWEFILQNWSHSLGGGWEIWEWIHHTYWGLIGSEGWGGLQGLYAFIVCLLWTCYLERLGFGSWRGLYIVRCLFFLILILFIMYAFNLSNYFRYFYCLRCCLYWFLMAYYRAIAYTYVNKKYKL